MGRGRPIALRGMYEGNCPGRDVDSEQRREVAPLGNHCSSRPHNQENSFGASARFSPFRARAIQFSVQAKCGVDSDQAALIIP